MTLEIIHPLVKFSGQIHIVLNKDGEEHIMSYEGKVPAQVEDVYKKILGNAQARVTVSADASNKNFGRGVNAMVSVTLSCNQDRETIDYAIKLAGDTARQFAREEWEVGEQEFKQLLERKGISG